MEVAVGVAASKPALLVVDLGTDSPDPSDVEEEGEIVLEVVTSDPWVAPLVPFLLKENY